jgi:hypothetical protein
MALCKMIQDQLKTCQNTVCPTPRIICHHGRLSSLAECVVVAAGGGVNSCPTTDLPAGGGGGGCPYANKVCLVATMTLCKMIQDQFQTCQKMACPTPTTICHHGRLSSLLPDCSFHVGGGANSCPTTVPTTINATLWPLLLLLPVSCGD